jgi:hypothetical protein
MRGFDFEEYAEHYARLALTPGWWDYARHAVKELENDDSGLFRGLYPAVRKRVDELRAAMAAERAKPERTTTPHGAGQSGQ